MKNSLLKNIYRMPELTRVEADIAIVIGSYPGGKFPSHRELAEKTGLNESTIEKALETLKKKDMIRGYKRNN